MEDYLTYYQTGQGVVRAQSTAAQAAIQTPSFNNYRDFIAWRQAGGNNVATSENNYRYLPAQQARDDRAASLIAGTTHDSLYSMPVNSSDNTRFTYGFNDQYYEKVDIEEAARRFGELPAWQRLAWANAAEALGGGPRTPESTYKAYLERSGDLSANGLNMDPLDLLMQDVNSGYMPKGLFSEDFSASSGGGYGSYGGGFGGGGGGGPQVNLMNENDARAVVNNLASQMLGRTVSDKEFQTYYKNLLQLQKDNPTTVEYGADGSTTVNESIGQAGLQYNLEEQMRNTEDFVTNAIGTQSLDFLEQYIASRRV